MFGSISLCLQMFLEPCRGLSELLLGCALHSGDDNMRCWHVLCTKFFHGLLFRLLLCTCDLPHSCKTYAMVLVHLQSVVSYPVGSNTKYSNIGGLNVDFEFIFLKRLRV
ncbi:hypothetical protein M758_11G124900 [Ceratodon purpureus]|uniref:Secreted protein n=1 Tax=Ceratodon purpureus TaxID=3225 RepID=A0A8T0GFJ8_CERPU|nr:hypothetical protein KC19_11G129200 [Ceratodon purpureus]KAG0601595.1 hypothetical protein M758_11G124900 [Ceratodon purpureus]